MKIKSVDKIKYTKKAMPTIKSLAASEEKRNKLIQCLRDGGFDDFADIAEDAKKYLPELLKDPAVKAFLAK